MAPQAQPLLTALPAHFAASRQSCYLYAASELVKTFGGDAAYVDALGAPLFQGNIGRISCHRMSWGWWSLPRHQPFPGFLNSLLGGDGVPLAELNMFELISLFTRNSLNTEVVQLSLLLVAQPSAHNLRVAFCCRGSPAVVC